MEGTKESRQPEALLPGQGELWVFGLVPAVSQKLPPYFGRGTEEHISGGEGGGQDGLSLCKWRNKVVEGNCPSQDAMPCEASAARWQMLD